MKIALIPNRDKPDAIEAAQRLLELLTARTSISVSLMIDPTRAQLLELGATLLVVLGGDGSILSIAQCMADVKIPVVGINFGKLGYLAAFSMEQFLTHLDAVLAGRAPMTQRLMLEGAIYRRPPAAAGTGILDVKSFRSQSPLGTGVALNDIVINAGHPFRMIELDVQIDGHATTTFRSDGVILATASGSTGYNLSAGGPLLSPAVPAMVLTPICPHSLSFRPVVLASESEVIISPLKLNEGSKVNFDGQFTHPLTEEDCLLIRRAKDPLLLVENPAVTHWQMLAQKLHWARSPRQ